MLLLVHFLQIRKLTEDTGQEEKRKEMLETRITVSSCHYMPQPCVFGCRKNAKNWDTLNGCCNCLKKCTTI